MPWPAYKTPPRGRTCGPGLFRMWTCGVDVRAVHSYVDSMTRYGADRWGRAGREIAASFRQEGSPAAALSKLDPPAPVLHLYAQPADEAVLQAQQAFARANPWFFVERLAARSHFPMVEVPGHMAETLDRFLFAHT